MPVVLRYKDEEGRKAISDAQALDLLADNEYHVTSAKGMKNSEIEDLLSPSTYKDALEKLFGVTLKLAALNLRTAVDPMQSPGKPALARV